MTLKAYHSLINKNLQDHSLTMRYKYEYKLLSLSYNYSSYVDHPTFITSWC